MQMAQDTVDEQSLHPIACIIAAKLSPELLWLPSKRFMDKKQPRDCLSDCDQSSRQHTTN